MGCGRRSIDFDYPWIAEAALKNRQELMIDGEVVVLGVDGVSDFNALHLRKPAGQRIGSR